MAKLNFQQPLLRYSVSHDPSQVILMELKKHFFLLTMLKTIELFNIFVQSNKKKIQHILYSLNFIFYKSFSGYVQPVWSV